jgi:hypothetical protein
VGAEGEKQAGALAFMIVGGSFSFSKISQEMLDWPVYGLFESCL